MPRRAVSRDLKARIPYLAYVEGFKVKEIGRILGVKKSIVPNPQLLHSRVAVSKKSRSCDL